MTPFMKSLQGSCYDYRRPQGGLLLGAAAVHTPHFNLTPWPNMPCSWNEHFLCIRQVSVSIPALFHAKTLGRRSHTLESTLRGSPTAAGRKLWQATVLIAKGRRKWRSITERSTSSISAAFISLAAPNNPTSSIKQSKVCYPSPVCPFLSRILTTSIVGLKHCKIHWPRPHSIHVPQLLYGRS